jgi:chromosome partitioning protein
VGWHYGAAFRSFTLAHLREFGMFTIALISQKGGVGKTTIAIHLATAFEAIGKQTLLIDLDPQTSAAEWKDSRQDDRPYVMAVPPSRLNKSLETARENGAVVVILDTAPHSEGTALDAARAADLILVPCKPSLMDLRAMRKTSDILNFVKKPTFAVLNEVTPIKLVADQAERAIINQFGLAVCPVRLGLRVAFSRCLLAGQTAQEYEPSGKAADEVDALMKWVSKTVGIPTSRQAGRRAIAKTGKTTSAKGVVA